MANDDRGILNLINIGTDIIITLSMYKDDTELALKRLAQNKEPSLTECRPVVNLPQLSLPTFSGDPKTWREFWSSTDTIIALSMYKDDTELALKRLAQNKEPSLTECCPVVNLPQLSLPTFSGDPKTWREFWSSFEASVHSQNIPDIQKLNYLVSCLRGNALQLVRGYDRALETRGYDSIEL
uniref:Uncharacterized protein n=1 Tax=Wuchereria bancrofti TaxID=6293 RepID=A0AAF5Q3U2_WUCBA